MKVTLTTVCSKFRQGDRLPGYAESLRELGFNVVHHNQHHGMYSITPFDIETDISTMDDILDIIHKTGYSVEIYYNGDELWAQIQDA